MDESVIEEHALAMEQGNNFPVVQVFYDGEVYWLADGLDCVAVAKKIGRVDTAALVRTGTRRGED